VISHENIKRFLRMPFVQPAMIINKGTLDWKAKIDLFKSIDPNAVKQNLFHIKHSYEYPTFW
jgi:hypothetical protein